MELKIKNKPNIGVTVAIGTAVGAGIFSATNELVWIASGIAIGAALGAGLNKGKNTKEN
tara:strand:- start:1216 stop:1392 length:177 start_codon:yes stop_codon:yes gene_type:complete